MRSSNFNERVTNFAISEISKNMKAAALACLQISANILCLRRWVTQIKISKWLLCLSRTRISSLDSSVLRFQASPLQAKGTVASSHLMFRSSPSIFLDVCFYILSYAPSMSQHRAFARSLTILHKGTAQSRVECSLQLCVHKRGSSCHVSGLNLTKLLLPFILTQRISSQT